MSFDSTTIPLRQCSKKDRCVHPERIADGWLPANANYFPKDASRKLGIRNVCAFCHREYHRKRNATDPIRYRSEKHQREIMTGMRVCSKCGREYPVTVEYFNNHKTCFLGLDTKCKACDLKKQRDARKYNPEKFHKKDRFFHQKYKEKERVSRKKHYVDKRPILIQQSRNWRNKNRDRVREKYREYYKNHPEKIKARARNRQALKHTEGSFTEKDVAFQQEKQHDQCYYCGINCEKFDIEHVIPISRGRSNRPDNIVLACQHCNSMKKDKMLEEWVDKITDPDLKYRVQQRIKERG